MEDYVANPALKFTLVGRNSWVCLCDAIIGRLQLFVDDYRGEDNLMAAS